MIGMVNRCDIAVYLACDVISHVWNIPMMCTALNWRERQGTNYKLKLKVRACQGKLNLRTKNLRRPTSWICVHMAFLLSFEMSVEMKWNVGPPCGA